MASTRPQQSLHDRRHDIRHLSHDTIEALPQGTNAPVEKVLLQAPGVSQDSAASGLLHVRNDHANVQFRINGVMLPDGVTGFGSVLDTSLIGSMSLITGALPAEFGLRTVGLVDITTRTDIFNNSGSVSLYGGSRGTIEPSFEYGGTFGGNCPATSHRLSARRRRRRRPGLFSRRAIFLHRPLSADHGRHRKSDRRRSTPSTISPQQEKGFGYMSAFIDPYTRLSLIAGTVHQQFPDSQCARGSRSIRNSRPCRRFDFNSQSSTRTSTRTPNLACWRCSVR